MICGMSLSSEGIATRLTGSTVVAGTRILSSRYNADMDDIYSILSVMYPRDGRIALEGIDATSIIGHTNATGILQVGDPAYAPETLTYRPNGVDVRFAISETSMQLHPDCIIVGVGNGATRPPNLTFKLPDHNATNAGGDHPLLSIAGTEAASAVPHSAVYTAGRAGGVGQPLIKHAFITQDSASVDQVRFTIGTGDNDSFTMGRLSGASSDAQGAFLQMHATLAHTVAQIHFTNGTTGIGSNVGAYFGLWSDENVRLWHYDDKQFVVGLNNAEVFRVLPGTAMVRRTVNGALINTIKVEAINSASGKTSTTQLSVQDNNAGVVRSMFYAAGPANGGSNNQGQFDTLVEDGTISMARLDSIDVNGGSRFYLNDRASVAQITMIAAANPYINLGTGGKYRVGNVNVVGARDTGWIAMTGTANKNTAYDTATVTLAQLAGRVMSMQTALTTHGLIGA